MKAMSTRWPWTRVKAALVAAAVAASLVPTGTALAPPPAGAALVAVPCGPGVEAKGCPPLCVKLLSASAIAGILHAGHLSGPVWHTDGVAEDYCTYSHGQGASVQVTVDKGSSPSEFEAQLKADHLLFPKATFAKLPAFGKYADSYVDCTVVIGSYPSLIVLARGFLVQVSDQLEYASMSVTVQRYLPLVEALAKALLAEA
jgi:hypothetical protein